MEKTVAMETAAWTDEIIPLLLGNFITFVKISHTDLDLGSCLDSVKVKNRFHMGQTLDEKLHVPAC